MLIIQGDVQNLDILLRHPMLLKDVKQEDKMHINPEYSCNGYLTTPEEVPRIL